MLWTKIAICQRKSVYSTPDLEKAASGASGACGLFVWNHAILRTFWVKYPVLLIEDGGRRIDDVQLSFDDGYLR